MEYSQAYIHFELADFDPDSVRMRISELEKVILEIGREIYGEEFEYGVEFEEGCLRGRITVYGSVMILLATVAAYPGAKTLASDLELGQFIESGRSFSERAFDAVRGQFDIEDDDIIRRERRLKDVRSIENIVEALNEESDPSPTVAKALMKIARKEGGHVEAEMIFRALPEWVRKQHPDNLDEFVDGALERATGRSSRDLSSRARSSGPDEAISEVLVPEPQTRERFHYKSRLKVSRQLEGKTEAVPDAGEVVRIGSGSD